MGSPDTARTLYRISSLRDTSCHAWFDRVPKFYHHIDQRLKYVWSIHENEYRFILGSAHTYNTYSTRGRLKGITTRSSVAYKGPTIPTTSSSPKVVECETKVTKDTVPPTNNGSTKDVQPPVVQVETQVLNSEPIVAPIVEPVEPLVSAPKPKPKPSIPYPSRLNDQKLCEKANKQMEKIFPNLSRFAFRH
ncbi:hypothetical protein Tco_1436976 [Tanacetum coccineum]